MSGSGDMNITEQPTAGLNVVPDDEATSHAEKLQKQQDLKKLDDEIKMLRQVLNDKVKSARQMRLDLGLATPLDNIEAATRNAEDAINKFAEDVSQTDAYKKTTETLTGVGKATADSFTIVGGAISDKFTTIQQSDSFNKLSQNVSSIGSSLLDSVTSMGKPKMQEFNEGSA